MFEPSQWELHCSTTGEMMIFWVVAGQSKIPRGYMCEIMKQSTISFSQVTVGIRFDLQSNHCRGRSGTRQRSGDKRHLAGSITLKFATLLSLLFSSEVLSMSCYVLSCHVMFRIYHFRWWKWVRIPFVLPAPFPFCQLICAMTAAPSHCWIWRLVY